jgi:vacuolar-type H+-ATPase subunit F/Vma7
MRATVRVICRPELAAGFGLAGMDALTAATPGEAATQISRISRASPNQVLLVQQDLLADEAGASGRQDMPLIVPFPGPDRTDPADAEATIVEILRRAIGYRVRLQ